jgi:hypothetical protein
MQGCHSRIARRLAASGRRRRAIRSASIGPFGSITASGEIPKLLVSEVQSSFASKFRPPFRAPLVHQWTRIGSNCNRGADRRVQTIGLSGGPSPVTCRLRSSLSKSASIGPGLPSGSCSVSRLGEYAVDNRRLRRRLLRTPSRRGRRAQLAPSRRRLIAQACTGLDMVDALQEASAQEIKRLKPNSPRHASTIEPTNHARAGSTFIDTVGPVCRNTQA